MNDSKHTLYGVGVGAGNGSLLTLEALEILKNTKVILVTKEKMGDLGRAYQIAKPHLRPDALVIPIKFPAVPRNEITKDLELQWKELAKQVNYILKDYDAVLLTMGDPSIYSALPYLGEYISKDYRTQIVPGVPIYSYMAGELNISLALAGESISILSAVNEVEKIENIIKYSDTIIIFNVAQNTHTIREILGKLKLTKNFVLFTNIGLENQKIIANINKLVKLPELSIILIKKNINFKELIKERKNNLE